MRRIAALSAALAVLAAAPLSAQNLLADGSFENPALASSATFTTIMNGSPLGAWTITSGSVDLIRTYWAPADGFQSIDLNGASPGTIAQTIATTAGSSYRLRFSMAGNPDNTFDKVMRVWWGTQDLGLVTFTQAGRTRTNMGWQTITFATLIASGPATTLRFEGQGATYWGAALDNIEVTLNVVPEPAAALLLSTGLFGCALLAVARLHSRQVRTAAATASQQQRSSADAA
jgi:choice-of-anchor C domain-containing protein